MKLSLKHIWASALVLGLLVVPAFAGTSATTEDTETESLEAEATAEEVTEVTFAGMKIAIDPKTGRMRAPTKREAKRLERQMKRMFRHVDRHLEGQEFTATSGGTRSMVLGREYLNFEVLQLDAEGNQVRSCADGVTPAAELLATPVSLEPQREEM